MTHKGGRLLSTLVCFLFSYLTLTMFRAINRSKRQIKGRVDRYEKIVVERIEMFHHY